MNEESMLPPSSRNGWKIVFALIGLLAVTGLVLSLVYRDSTKPGEVIRKAQRKAATRVVYTIVFSKIDAAQSERIIREIVQDLGADTSTADLIIGSPVTDPWCASISEYKRNLHKAMTETRDMPIGKQSIVVSMVAGLLTKNELPARVYLVGRINGEDVRPIAQRTAKTVAAIELRSNIMGPVSVVSYLWPADAAANKGYARLFEEKGFPFEQRIANSE
ncbi:MAG TPA: hypothetical protein VK147_09280 [Candidatus Didemnitutus sp.]|nr:hypothetical protein [Candidatus Didemnitutus sp.]